MLRLALVQFRPRKGAYAENLAQLEACFREAGALSEPPDLLLLPETALSRYFLEGGVREQARTAEQVAEDIAGAHRASGAPPVDLALGFYELWRNCHYNSCLYLSLGAGPPLIRHVHTRSQCHSPATRSSRCSPARRWCSPPWRRTRSCTDSPACTMAGACGRSASRCCTASSRASSWTSPTSSGPTAARAWSPPSPGRSSISASGRCSSWSRSTCRAAFSRRSWSHPRRCNSTHCCSRSTPSASWRWTLPHPRRPARDADARPRRFALRPFQARRATAAAPTAEPHGAPLLADLTGDGITDVLAINHYSDRFGWPEDGVLLQPGVREDDGGLVVRDFFRLHFVPGGGKASDLRPLHARYNWVWPVDWDADGLTDLLYVSMAQSAAGPSALPENKGFFASPGYITFLKNDGTKLAGEAPLFREAGRYPAAELTENAYVPSLACADLDGARRADLVGVRTSPPGPA